MFQQILACNSIEHRCEVVSHVLGKLKSLRHNNRADADNGANARVGSPTDQCRIRPRASADQGDSVFVNRWLLQGPFHCGVSVVGQTCERIRSLRSPTATK